jgi:hypothetical protein
MIGPTAGVDHDRMRTVIVAAEHDEQGRAGLRISPIMIFCCLGMDSLTRDWNAGAGTMLDRLRTIAAALKPPRPNDPNNRERSRRRTRPD